MNVRNFLLSGLLRSLGRKKNGLTIVEIILSIAIVAVSAVILIRVFLAAASLNDRAREHTQAVMSAISILDLVGDEEYQLLLRGEDTELFDALSLTPLSDQGAGASGTEGASSNMSSEGSAVKSLRGTKELDSSGMRLEVLFGLWESIPESARGEGNFLLVRVHVFSNQGKEIYFAEKRIHQKGDAIQLEKGGSR